MPLDHMTQMILKMGKDNPANSADAKNCATGGEFRFIKKSRHT